MNDIAEILKSLLLTLGILGASIAILGATWLSSVSRNPEATNKMFVPGIIALSCIEIVNIALIGLLFLTIGKL